MLLSLTDKALDQFLRGVPTYQLASPKTRAHDALELIRRRLWGRSRNCPICIRENILPAEQFDFSLTLRCERHQTLLWDRCIRCGALTVLRDSHHRPRSVSKHAPWEVEDILYL